ENFSIKAKAIVNSIHGEYGELERNAMQRYALLRMALMFRKFIPIGITKRYRKGGYSERYGDYVEGYYRSTARFITNFTKDLFTLKFNLLAQDWTKLTNHEKANFRRTATEMAF